MRESVFFQDLAVLMVLAGVVAAVFSRFGWPKAIGYILAGVLMSKYTWGGSFLLDADSIRTLSQLGVVFLMFGMGLDFSAKDMKRIRGVAGPVAVLDVLVMMFLGWFVGTRVFHWGSVQSLFLGVAICDSATTLLAKVLEEMGWGRRVFAKYVLGTSVCEDILCVGAIAVATGCAQGNGMSFGAFAASLGWLALFFVAVLVFGLILVPRLLQGVGRRKDGEALLLVTIACCFLVSYVAYKFEFSTAIGAFLVGLVCSSSVEKMRLGALVEPLKSLFSAMFFMAIGLLVDPAALWHCLPEILVVSLVVVVAKSFNVLTMSLVTGLDIKTSVQNALSLAQIGEFAFMTAILYAVLTDDPSNRLFPVAVGASLLTTLLNPTLIRLSDRAGDFAVHHTSPQVKRLLSEYRAWLERIGASKGSLAYTLARRAALKVLIFDALILAVGVMCVILSRLDYSRFSVVFERWSGFFYFAVFNLFVAAMLPLLHHAGCALADEVTEMVVSEGAESWKGLVRRIVIMLVRVALAALLVFEVTAVNLTAFPHLNLALWTVLGVMAVVAVAGWRFFAHAGRQAANQLYEAIAAEDRQAGSDEPLAFRLPDGSVGRVTIAPGSPAVGRTIGELAVRSRTGVNVLSVRRNGRVHHNIGSDWTCEAGDVLVVLGGSAQVRACMSVLGSRVGRDNAE